MKKLLVKDFDLWYEGQEIMYASTEGLRMYVKLKAAPNFPRYIVRDTKLSIEHTFTNKSLAIRKFNDLANR